MGLFRQLLKVIEWKDDSTDQIVYRYPMTDRDEIMNGCQLVVRPSQVAILVVWKLFRLSRPAYLPQLHSLQGWREYFRHLRAAMR